jgi:hypothetical protein
MKTLRTMVMVALLAVLLAPAQEAQAYATLCDGSFELGSPNPCWEEHSTHGWTLIQNEPASALHGSYMARLGSCDGCGEVGKVGTWLPLPKKGSVTLVFYLLIDKHDPAGSDKLQVSMDGDKLLTIPETDSSYHSAYTEVFVTLDGYVDGGLHTLQVKGTDKSGSSTAFLIDYFYLIHDGIENGDMELDSNSDGVPDGWKVDSPSGKSKRVCDVGYLSPCSFRLRGTGQPERLIYIYKPGVLGWNGDEFTLRGFLKFEDVPPGSARTQIVAVHFDGSQTVLIDEVMGDGTLDWDGGSIPFTVTGGDYKKLKITIEYNAPAGYLWIDGAALDQTTVLP